TAQVENLEHSSTASYMVGMARAPQDGAAQLIPRPGNNLLHFLHHFSFPDTHASLKQWEHEVDHSSLRRRDAPLSDRSAGLPARFDAAGSSIDQKSIIESPQVADDKNPDFIAWNPSQKNGVPKPRDASTPVHESQLKGVILHDDPTRSKKDRLPDSIRIVSGDNKHPLRSHPMPGIGPFPPDYLSDGPASTLDGKSLSTYYRLLCSIRFSSTLFYDFLFTISELARHSRNRMVVRAERVGHMVSRLITPYFPGSANTTACLSIVYLLDGEGADSIAILAQDTSNRALFKLENRGPEWRTYQHALTVHQDIRFFIEAYTKSHAKGVIAIDKFIYSLTPCF
ncbi:unnamed protein product, partial [Ixodes hexagonus]